MRTAKQPRDWIGASPPVTNSASRRTRGRGFGALVTIWPGPYCVITDDKKPCMQYSLPDDEVSRNAPFSPIDEFSSKYSTLDFLYRLNNISRV